MINLNLKTDGNFNKEKIRWGKAMPLAITILAVVGLAYLAILFYTKKINNDITVAQNSYNQKLDDLKNGNAKNVFDFQSRLSESKKMLDSSINPGGNLKEIENAMIPGVYIKTYTFDGENKSLNLDCIASNYNDVAKQIFSFKKSTFFSGVSAGDSSLSGQDGKISFKIDLKIK